MIICYDNQIINLYMGWKAIHLTVCRDFGWEISPSIYSLTIELNDKSSCLNDDASYNNLLNGKSFHITWSSIIERKTFFEENEVVITQAFERALNGKNKNCNNYFGSLRFYITRHWHDLQFAFAFLDYLTIRITFDKYEKESCIWRTLNQHNIINNPENCDEIRQTVVTIHKLHLSINAVNSILNFNSNSIATEKERVHNNYYNYWI